ncbi:SDR family NAD(P)-dependent oxidoreductase, partial [Halomonas marinisediminis]
AFDAVRELAEKMGGIDILVNNAAQQWLETELDDVTEDHLRRTFDSNVMGYFFCTQAAADHLPEGGAIINTASVNAFKGNAALISYSSPRGATTAFSRSIASQLVSKGIR